jgi:hypothetical protein
MDEMRNLIALRNGGLVTPSRRHVEAPSTSPAKENNESLQNLIFSVENDLQGALESHDSLQAELQRFAARWREVRSRHTVLIYD